ncbi:MAG TPA: hypothetical protein VGA53_00775 [Candidatus Paceibacterota bacterium]
MSRLVNCRQPHTNKTQKDSVLPYLLDFDKLSYQAPRPVVCKNKKSSHAFGKIAVLLLVVGIVWTGVSSIPRTVAYFSDGETSGGNLLAASLLDFELESPGDFEPKVSKHQHAARQISVVDINSIPFHYRSHAENFAGELCQFLLLEANVKGTEKFSGPLMNFEAGDFGFDSPSGGEDWDFAVKLQNQDIKGECAFDFVFSGWQMPFPLLFSGFHDVERISSLVTAKETEPDDDKCEEDEDEEDDHYAYGEHKEDKDDRPSKGDKPGEKGEKGDKCGKGDKGDKPGEKGEKGEKPDDRDDHEDEYEDLLSPEATEEQGEAVDNYKQAVVEDEEGVGQDLPNEELVQEENPEQEDADLDGTAENVLPDEEYVQ